MESLDFAVDDSETHTHTVTVHVKNHLLPQYIDDTPLWEERRPEHKVRYLVVHCLDASSADEAVHCLTQHRVSAHYGVTPEGEVFCMVHPRHVAYHAGESRFHSDAETPLYVKRGVARGVRTLNYTSLGVEFLSPGYAQGGRDWFRFTPFTERQRRVGVQLIAHLVARFDIDADNILAHSDVAPFRRTNDKVFFAKSDPGPFFFWEALRERGLSLPLPVCPPLSLPLPLLSSENDQFNSNNNKDGEIDSATVLWAQESLRIIGYCGTPLSAELDLPTACVLVAFELHFVPAKFCDPSYAQEALNTLDKRKILTRETLHALKELREYKMRKNNDVIISGKIINK